MCDSPSLTLSVIRDCIRFVLIHSQAQSTYDFTLPRLACARENPHSSVPRLNFKNLVGYFFGINTQIPYFLCNNIFCFYKLSLFRKAAVSLSFFPYNVSHSKQATVFSFPHILPTVSVHPLLRGPLFS